MKTHLTYAKIFGPAYGKGKSPKLHRTQNGKSTLCGLPCFGPSKESVAWTNVCGRCARIAGKAVCESIC